MGRNFSFFLDDESGELVGRYEKYLTGAASGYFDVDEMERIVEYYLAYGRTKDSLNAVELGKKLHPASSQLDMKRAKIYLSTGDVNKAYRILAGLVEESDIEVNLLKIEALSRMERLQESWELAQIMLDGEVDELDLLAMDVAMIFMSESHFDYALKALKVGDEYNPKNVDLLFDMGLCMEQNEDLEDAKKIYLRIIDIDSFIGEAWFDLGQVHFMLDEFEAAIDAYDYALAINDEDDLSLIHKAHAHFQLGQWQTAIDGYLAYAETTSEKWQAMLFVGECYENLEEFYKALYYYELSYKEMPDNYETLIGISICLLEMEEYEESLKYNDKAMELTEELADVWVYRAEAYVGMDRYDDALHAYHQSISIDPNQPDTLLAIANLYMDQLDPAMALKYYELAYSFDETLEYIELFLAVVNYYLGNVEDTLKYLELAVQRNLDAAPVFLEFCPDAEELFSDITKPEIQKQK